MRRSRTLAPAALAAGLAMLIAAPQSRAQAQTEAAPEVESQVLCQKLDLSKPLSPQQLEAAQLCQQVSKLQEEVKSIRTANEATSRGLGLLIPWTGIITGLITGLVAVLVPVFGILFRRSFEKSQKSRLEQERMLQREAHNFKLMEGLGSDNRAVQLASASSLLRRVEDIRTNGERAGGSEIEVKTLSDVIVSVLRDPQIDESVSKYLADEMIAVFGFRTRDASAGPAAKRAGDGAYRSGRLRDFNMQRTRLRNVYWANVIADGVDFFKADFSGASLRNANLKGAVLYEADLSNAALVDASLDDANLQGADLRGARLSGASFRGARNLDSAAMDRSTTWDDTTVWPDGFHPRIDPATS